MKHGKPDNISIDRLKPAFKFEENSTEEQREITQPQESDEPETQSVDAGTEEITVRDYRAALLRDPQGPGKDAKGPKRTYVKAKSERRTESIPTRFGRISRPPTRL